MNLQKCNTPTFPQLNLVEAAQWRNVFTVWCGSSHRPQHNPTSQGWTGTAAHYDINNQQRWRYNDSSPHLHQNLNSCLFGPTWTVSSSTATLTSVTSLSTHTTQDETCHQNGFMQPPSSVECVAVHILLAMRWMHQQILISSNWDGPLMLKTDVIATPSGQTSAVYYKAVKESELQNST